ncbi:MAG: hypothetical protein AB2A00_40040 [Myxococcota bacterium]
MSRIHQGLPSRSVLGACLLAAWGLGCATSTAHTGAMPQPPRDEELFNDGSDEMQTALYRRYRVHLKGDVVHIGDAVRPRRATPLIPDAHPDVRAYLSSDPQATEALGSSLAVPAYIGMVLMTAAIPVATIGAPTALALGIVLVGAMDILAWRYVYLPQLRPFAAGLNVATSALFTCLMVVVGISGVLPGHVLGLAGAAFWEGSIWRGRHNLDDAAAIYNDHLRRRIESSVRTPPAAEPAPPTTLPTPTTSP